MAQVTADMEAKEIADIIFFQFDLHQSCKIEGWEYIGKRIHPKGELVCDEIWNLDRKHNCYVKDGSKTALRIRKRPANSIGGYAAHKIFKWERFILDNYVKYTIWRIQ